MTDDDFTLFDMMCHLGTRLRRAMIMAILTLTVTLLGAALALMWGTWLMHLAWESAPAFGYGHSLLAVLACWLVHWAVRWIKFVTPPGGRPKRMSGTDQTEESNYSGWNKPMRVTLTETTNPHLLDELPLAGLLNVHEMRTDDYAQPRHVSFQRLLPDGNVLGPPVMVDDAAFLYTPPDPIK